MIDQMDKPDNDEESAPHSHKTEQSHVAPPDASRNYYYDDSTGYELFKDDEADEPENGALSERDC